MLLSTCELVQLAIFNTTWIDWLYEKEELGKCNTLIFLYSVIFLNDLSQEFEFKTLLVKFSYNAYETPKTKN